MVARGFRRKSGFGFRRVALIAVGTLLSAGVTTALASSVTTYKGTGKGALKDTATLKLSAGKVVSYSVSIETLCGQVNLGGRQTVVWPVTPNAREAPLKVHANGKFSGKQHQSTTIPAISHVTTEPAPGTYSFTISGSLNRARTKISGHVSLQIETTTGYFCTATSSPFVATKK